MPDAVRIRGCGLDLIDQGTRRGAQGARRRRASYRASYRTVIMAANVPIRPTLLAVAIAEFRRERTGWVPSAASTPSSGTRERGQVGGTAQPRRREPRLPSCALRPTRGGARRWRHRTRAPPRTRASSRRNQALVIGAVGSRPGSFALSRARRRCRALLHTRGSWFARR